MTEADCPDPTLLRALIEPEALEGLLPEVAAAKLRAHALACPVCQKRLALVSREDRLLRGLATPVAPDPAALEATLAFVRKAARATPSGKTETSPERGTPSGSRGLASRRARTAEARSVPWVALGAALALGLVAFVVLRSRSPGEGTAPESATSPEPTRSPDQRPAPTTSTSPSARPSSAPGAPASPTPAPEVSPERQDTAPVALDPTPTPAPDALPSPTGPVAIGPTPTPDTSPAATPGDTTGRVLAHAGSSGLLVKGRELALGEALPEGATIDVKIAGAAVESDGAASILLAQHTSLTLERGREGEASFVVSAGKALVMTTGANPYAIGSGDVFASVAPSAASPALRPSTGSATFVISVEGTATTVTTLEGAVRLDARRPVTTDVATVIPAGFGVAAVRGKLRDAPQPVDVARAVEWLPKKVRPAKLPAPRRVVRALEAEADRRLVTDGTLAPADATAARAFLVGAQGSYDQKVVRWSDKSPSLAKVSPDMLVEVTLRVSRASRVAIMVWNDTANENFEWTREVPAGRWVTLVAPLSAFANKAKAARSTVAGDVVHALFVGAGPDARNVELSVQSARFLAER